MIYYQLISSIATNSADPLKLQARLTGKSIAARPCAVELKLLQLRLPPQFRPPPQPRPPLLSTTTWTASPLPAPIWNALLTTSNAWVLHRTIRPASPTLTNANNGIRMNIRTWTMTTYYHLTSSTATSNADQLKLQARLSGNSTAAKLCAVESRPLQSRLPPQSPSMITWTVSLPPVPTRSVPIMILPA